MVQWQRACWGRVRHATLEGVYRVAQLLVQDNVRLLRDAAGMKICEAPGYTCVACSLDMSNGLAAASLHIAWSGILRQMLRCHPGGICKAEMSTQGQQLLPHQSTDYTACVAGALADRSQLRVIAIEWSCCFQGGRLEMGFAKLTFVILNCTFCAVFVSHTDSVGSVFERSLSDSREALF